MLQQPEQPILLLAPPSHEAKIRSDAHVTLLEEYGRIHDHVWPLYKATLSAGDIRAMSAKAGLSRADPVFGLYAARQTTVYVEQRVAEWKRGRAPDPVALQIIQSFYGIDYQGVRHDRPLWVVVLSNHKAHQRIYAGLEHNIPPNDPRLVGLWSDRQLDNESVLH